MDWEAAGVVAATVMSAVAVVVSFWGQRKATAEARRAADAAERSAEAAERSAPTAGVGWGLVHFQNDGYLLTNEGRAPAYDVRVDLGRSILGAVPEVAVVEPDDFVKFNATRIIATGDDTVTVTWVEKPGGGTRSRWSRPLPPRPPRQPAPSLNRR